MKYIWWKTNKLKSLKVAKWSKDDEGWMVNDEGWMKNDELWMENDEGWWFIAILLTDKQMDGHWWL